MPRGQLTRGQLTRRLLLAAAPAGLTLAACTREAPPAPSATPTPRPPAAPEKVGKQGETVDPTTVRLPLEMTTQILVKPGWTARPLQLDGIFLGHEETAEGITLRAIREDGTVLWTAKRPATCTGYAVSPSDKGPVAILADAMTSGKALARVAVTAYSLDGGEQLWGPVPVPGPQAAPGLVFAQPSKEPMGRGGPRVALEAGTGKVLVEESALKGGQILAEHLGTVLHTQGENLVAVGAGQKELWRVPLPQGIAAEKAHVPMTPDTTAPFMLLRGDGAAGALISLSDGAVLAEGVTQAAIDHEAETTVVTSGRTVRGIQADGEDPWAHEDPEELQLISAGGRLAYAARPEEKTLVVLDSLQGLMVQPFDVDTKGPLGIPEVFTAEGGACVRVGADRVLVTTTLDENYGIRTR